MNERDARFFTAGAQAQHDAEAALREVRIADEGYAIKPRPTTEDIALALHKTRVSNDDPEYDMEVARKRAGQMLAYLRLLDERYWK